MFQCKDKNIQYFVHKFKIVMPVSSTSGFVLFFGEGDLKKRANSGRKKKKMTSTERRPREKEVA